MFLSPSFLLLLIASTTSAFPKYQDDRSLEETASCPMIQAGPKMEEALSLAATRREAWEAAYPSTSFERKYTPGVKSDGEIFCDGNEEHQFCNKVCVFFVYLMRHLALSFFGFSMLCLFTQFL